MQTFKDAQGFEWKMSINVSTIDIIEQETGVDLLMLDRRFLTPAEEQDPSKRKWVDDNGEPMVLATRLQVDDRLLYSIMWATCMAQADGANIPPPEFAERLTSQWQEAEKAFFVELANFYQSLGKDVYAKMLMQAAAVFEKMFEVQAGTWDRMDTDQVVTEAMEKVDHKTTSGGSSTPKSQGKSPSSVGKSCGQSEGSSESISEPSLRVSSTG